MATLFHGTNTIIDAISLAKGRARTDFGKGFYLTDKLETAHRWAAVKTELAGTGIPTVIRYEVNNDIFKLHGKRFSHVPELDWLDFICSNRRAKSKTEPKREPRHDFNWVSGPIADDKVFDVVKDYMADDINADEAIRRARVLEQTFQLSLHTDNAISFVDDINISYRQYRGNGWTKNWVKR